MPRFDDTQTNQTLSRLHQKEEENLLQTLAPKYGYAYISLQGSRISREALLLIDSEVARMAEVALFKKEGDVVHLAVRNPKTQEVPVIVSQLESRGFTVTIYLASLASLEYAWERYDDAPEAVAEKKGTFEVDSDRVEEFSKSVDTHLDVAAKVNEILNQKSSDQTSLLVSSIFGGALALAASDIHIEPEAKMVRVRYRVDGVLWDVSMLPRLPAEQIISRLKLLAGTRLNVKDEAQDGKFTFVIGKKEIDVRTSVIPGSHGESVVMRLLDPSGAQLQMENLGMSPRMFEVISKELERPNGAIITTGPTGSGKTTALYAFLNRVHTPHVKIVTLEDPVEYKLQGIVQTQVGDDYSFAQGLRTILRQDPDVILVGEIRDREVAETAMQAALTGHLMFSTLHTNSAGGAVPRLVDLGVDPKTIGSACNILLGQRLVRKLCEHCKTEHALTIEEQKLLQRVLEQPVSIDTVFEAKGCDKCGGSGYKGRIGVFEAIQIDEKVSETILMDTRERTVREAAKPQNIPTMQQDGLMKVLGGITSLDEVSRVLDLYHID